MSHMYRRIGIDCRLAGLRHAGIGRYIENLVQRLPKLAPEVTWVLFFHDKVQAQTVLGPLFESSNIEIHYASIRHYSLAEQLVWPKLLSAAHLDLLHVPHFNVPWLYQGRVVVTIHDLLWHEYRGTNATTLSPVWYWLKYLAYRQIVSQAVRKAALIFVPALTIKQTLGVYYPKAVSKVVVTKEGVSATFLDAPKMGTHRANKELVYVGSLYPHKNVKLVIEALHQLPKYHLTLVGSRTVFQDQLRLFVREQQLTDRVTFAGYLSDQQLLELYGQAAALVQPSLSEGFGLTGIEAMAAGVPVLASDIPIFHEIYGSAATYFDPKSVSAFAVAVESLSQQSRAQSIHQGLEKAAQYSWQTMVEETWAAYQSVLR